jgi:hypothetical protein
MVAGRWGWAVHRFNIKGGKSMRDTVWKDWTDKIAANVTKNNSLLEYLKGRK